MNLRFGYLIVYVPDVAATLAFYERAFGLAARFVHESGVYAELETGATALAFLSEEQAANLGHAFRRNRADAEPAGVEIALVAEDVAAAFARAVNAGAVPSAAPEEKPWGQTVAYVRDPNGVLVELCSPMD